MNFNNQFFSFCCLLTNRKETKNIKRKKHKEYDSILYSNLSLRSIYEENISYSGHINYIRPQIYHNICLYSYIHLQFNPQFLKLWSIGQTATTTTNISQQQTQIGENNGITHLYKFHTMDAICFFFGKIHNSSSHTQHNQQSNLSFTLHYRVYLLSLHKLLKKEKLKKKSLYKNHHPQ